MKSIYYPLNFSTVLTLTTADYECLCNYDITNAVRSQPRSEARNIGSLYEFDCKPTYQLTSSTQNWQAVQYENQVNKNDILCTLL